MNKYKFVKILQKSIPTLLTITSVIGLGATAYIVAKKTPDANADKKKAEEKKGSKLTKLETVKAMVPAYTSAIVTGTATAACMIAANVTNKKRQGALASALCLSQKALSDYKSKVTELYGKESEEKVIKAIAKGRIAKAIEKNPDLSVVPEGSNIYYFPYYGEEGIYITLSAKEMSDISYQFNRKFALHGYASLNELLDLLNAPAISEGEELGWSLGASYDYGYENWIEFEYILDHAKDLQGNDFEYYILTLPVPTYDYLEYGCEGEK